MSCTFPFNQIKKGSSVIAGPGDFIYGTGTYSMKGDDSALTTADGLIHNFRNAITPEASCDVKGDKRSLDTAAPDSSGNVWPALSDTITLQYVPSPGGTAADIAEFDGIISVEYDTKENKSTINITGCQASY